MHTLKLVFYLAITGIRATRTQWQLSLLALFFYASFGQVEALAQPRKPPAGGRIAVVVDERLSALRDTPQLTGRILRRLGRGRLVAIRGIKRSEDGVIFLLVNVTARTHGWIQREAVVSGSHPGDDQRLFLLMRNSSEFDRLARARIFLDQFPRSLMRAEVLLLFGDAAEEAATRLSRDASRRISEAQMGQDGVPAFSYFLNYSGLDRYNRLGVRFIFENASKQFHYDGRAWLEVVRRYPKSLQSADARRRLADLAAIVARSVH